MPRSHWPASRSRARGLLAPTRVKPAELIGYWISTYGKRLPQPTKRGVADADCSSRVTQALSRA
jgi:hypothetical protein